MFNNLGARSNTNRPVQSQKLHVITNHIFHESAMHLVYLRILICIGSGPDVIKIFSYSIQLCMTCKLLIITEIAQIN